MDPDTPGAVRGKVCLPAKDSPPLVVYFENVETLKLNVLEMVKDQTTYNLGLDPGQYIAYAYLNHSNTPGGLYSQAVACGLTKDCTDHSPLVFEVKPGQTLSGIDICDWDARKQVPANPAPSDQRLAGMAYTLNSVNYFRYDERGKSHFLMSTPFDPEAPFILSVSPDGTRGIFRDEEQNDLFLVDFTAGRQFNLTNTPQMEETAYWWEPSMPGKILFRALLAGEENAPGYIGMLFAIGADGSDLRVIDNKHGSCCQSVSPNGRIIAFGVGATAYLYTWGAGVSEFNPRQYSPDLPADVFISSPSWSPNGKKISWHLSGSFSEQFHSTFGVFDLEENTVQLTHRYTGNGYGGYPWPAVWSPNGKWLALPVRQEFWELWLVNAGKPDDEDFLGNSTYDPVWHPEGKWLAYTHRDEYGGSEFSEVWLINPGKPEQKVLMGERTSGPWWSLDGEWLAYHQDLARSEADESVRKYKIWLYNPDSGEHLKTSLPPGAQVVDW
jgi:Tol biopolymer transport system component